jgi:hypothetical protein
MQVPARGVDVVPQFAPQKISTTCGVAMIGPPELLVVTELDVWKVADSIRRSSSDSKASRQLFGVLRPLDFGRLRFLRFNHPYFKYAIVNSVRDYWINRAKLRLTLAIALQKIQMSIDCDIAQSTAGSECVADS